MGVVPLRSRLPSVVTIHDATFFSHPELHQPAKVRWFRALLPRAAAAARLVLTDSLVSQAELARFGVASPDRIRVIPLAVDRRFRPPAPGAVASLRRDLGLTEPYVLFAGVLEPRKNLPRLIAAVLELRRRGFPHRLVLAGKPGWDRAPTEAAIATAGSAVVRLGFVPDETLRTLLGGSDAFAYVPLAEGFGLPVAEALACGAVVVTSALSSLPEVAAGAAELVDPFDVGAIADGLARVLQDPDLRARRVEAGLARAAELTPERLGSLTLAAYREALELG